MKLETRQLAVAGVLSAVAIILSVTPLGFIPLPTLAGSATIMHIPVIIAAIMEGPMIGAFVGLIFGITSFLRGGAFFVDPVIAIIPRVLVGVFAAYSYKLFSKYWAGAIIAAVVGTLTNTLGVLSLAIVRDYLNLEAAISISLLHGIPEVIIGAIITVTIINMLIRADIKN